jgi:signal transduction histidine kinase
MGFASRFDHGVWFAAHWYMVMWVPVELTYIGVFAVTAYRRRTADSMVLAGVSPICMIYFTWLLLRDSPDALVVSAYVWLPMYVAMGLVLLDRFAKSLNEAEQLNANLEQRVAQKQAELQSNFQRLQLLEREQTIAEERSRIMSDMHDGIGAQLISTIGLAEHGTLSQQEMAAALRECLDDLRLTIDSLEPTDNDLLPALGNFRYRVDPRLRRQGINLDWRVSDLPKLACLTPRNLLHVLRILQEAFTNVLKHAHASMIHVETGLREGGQQVFIRVSDNGAGFSGEHRGRGLANMQQRAERIGGSLQVAPSASGTTLELLLPVA